MSGLVISITTGFAFVCGALAIVFGCYFAARKILNPGLEGDRTHDAATTVAVRIAALHGLILALVYAQELDDYKGIRNNLIEEAVAISDVYNDAVRYGRGDCRADPAGPRQLCRDRCRRGMGYARASSRPVAQGLGAVERRL
ncbi:hypothetical protein LP421_29560 [Rhizobium sp. RCAM05350]|nr:hypothetical protein LP421_29560 [Rhizobium sp. RCAM05350]